MPTFQKLGVRMSTLDVGPPNIGPSNIGPPNIGPSTWCSLKKSGYVAVVV